MEEVEWLLVEEPQLVELVVVELDSPALGVVGQKPRHLDVAGHEVHGAQHPGVVVRGVHGW